MKKFEINEVLQEDLSYYGELLKKRQDELNHYRVIMKKKLDDLKKAENEYYCNLLDEGYSEYDAGLTSSEVFESSFEDVYRYEDDLLGGIKYAEIRFKIALCAYANIKYLSDDSEV